MGDVLIPHNATFKLIQGEGPISLVGSHCVDFYGYKDVGGNYSDDEAEDDVWTLRMRMKRKRIHPRKVQSRKRRLLLQKMVIRRSLQGRMGTRRSLLLKVKTRRHLLQKMMERQQRRKGSQVEERREKLRRRNPTVLKRKRRMIVNSFFSCV